jgi:glycosyltransferase involved in cell wall biosynthesis
MNRPSPRVSVGMPVYNGRAFVAEAIQSVLNQTFPDFELIITDNASTDSTEAICRRFADADDRIKYYRLENNIGACGNFNHVFRLARGKYFKWAAADDVFLPTFLEKLVTVLDADQGVVWCHTQSGKINQFGDVLQLSDPAAEGLPHTTHAGLPRPMHDSPQRHQRFRGVLLGTTWCADIYGLIRRDALLKTGLLESCYGAEKVLIGGLSLLGRYREVPETLFYQRIHDAASGKLVTAAEQAKYACIKHTRRFSSARLKLLTGHLRMTNRIAMPRRERALCHLVVLQYLFQFHKWPGILRSMLLRTGLGH